MAFKDIMRSIIPLPTTRQAQVARKKLISVAKEHQVGKARFDELLHGFFCEAKDDPVLETILAKKAYTILNNYEETSSFRSEWLEFVQELSNLPLADEATDPYCLCATENERIDREIVNMLHSAFPELLQDEIYVSFLDEPRCAYFCYAIFADLVNGALELIPVHPQTNFSYTFITEAFCFIEMMLELDNPHANSVVMLSFLEHLTDKNKEKWVKLLGSISRDIYEQEWSC
jgi:hypothetical protein